MGAQSNYEGAILSFSLDDDLVATLTGSAVQNIAADFDDANGNLPSLDIGSVDIDGLQDYTLMVSIPLMDCFFASQDDSANPLNSGNPASVTQGVVFSSAAVIFSTAPVSDVISVGSDGALSISFNTDDDYDGVSNGLDNCQYK